MAVWNITKNINEIINLSLNKDFKDKFDIIVAVIFRLLFLFILYFSSIKVIDEDMNNECYNLLVNQS